MPVDSLQEQEDRDAEGRFTKGHSGNPQGRRLGSRNKATTAAELLLESLRALPQTTASRAS